LDAHAGNGGKMEYESARFWIFQPKSDLMGEFEPNFNITYIYLFVAVALFYFGS